MQPKPIRAVYNTPMRRFLLLCSWLTNEFAKFTNRQNQSVRYAFYYVYVCPTSAHRGFRYGYRHYKDNTFILETTWFGRKSMILRFGLTLFNINISKKFTLSCFFLLKSFHYQWLFVCFAASVLAKPLNNAQIVRGVFCLYTFEHGESHPLYKTVWIFRKSRKSAWITRFTDLW